MKASLCVAASLLFLFASGCVSSKNSLINPSIRNVRRLPMPPARKKVEDLVQKHIAAGNATEVAVYFHSLSTGYWFGINEQQKFIPASLLKVYLLIRVLIEEEDYPGTLKTLIKLRSEEKQAVPIVTPYKRLSPGGSYSVETLLEQMILYSDNDAAFTLHTRFGDAKMEKIYRDFGFSTQRDEDDSLTLKQYLMVFLTLYNGTYLGTDMSQKALQYLVKVDFQEGLAAGLPEDLQLANKFGERGVETSYGRTQQLHDCGIVYYKDYPYILGVMTRGQDIKKLAGIIKEVSALVYAEVDYRTRESKR